MAIKYAIFYEFIFKKIENAILKKGEKQNCVYPEAPCAVNRKYIKCLPGGRGKTIWCVPGGRGTVWPQIALSRQAVQIEICWKIIHATDKLFCTVLQI